MEPVSYLVSRAEKYEERGDYLSAEKLWTVILSIQEKNWGKESPKLIDTLYNFGLLYIALDDFAKAEKLLLKCLEIERKTLAPNHPDIAETVNTITALHLERYFSRAQQKALSA